MSSCRARAKGRQVHCVHLLRNVSVCVFAFRFEKLRPNVRSLKYAPAFNALIYFVRANEQSSGRWRRWRRKRACNPLEKENSHVNGRFAAIETVIREKTRPANSHCDRRRVSVIQNRCVALTGSTAAAAAVHCNHSRQPGYKPSKHVFGCDHKGGDAAVVTKRTIATFFCRAPDCQRQFSIEQPQAARN